MTSWYWGCIWITLCLGHPGLAEFSYYDNPPRLYFLHMYSDIRFRFATTLITSRLVNPANHTQDVVFNVTLPEEAFISNFTLEIDGVVYGGIVKEKEQAKKDYERAKKRGQSAGLVSQKPRDTRQFKVEIAIAAYSNVSFNLTYQELLKRSKGMYEHKLYISPGVPVKDFKVQVAIQESRDITRLEVPPLRPFSDLLSNEPVKGTNPFAVINQQGKRSVYIDYSVPLYDQGDLGLSGQFVVKYDVERALDAGEVLVVNGYFVHFLAPDVKEHIPKDIIFILDVSGSMLGTKIEQLKDAMVGILDDLVEGDRFNIITFNSGIKKYKKEMTEVNENNIRKAREFIQKKVRATGGTNINEALLDGLDVFKSVKTDRKMSPVVIFLTDGEPTSGVTNTQTILRNIQEQNQGEIPVYSLSFGKNADWKFVKQLAGQNNGVGRKIYEDSDASLQISGFYDDVSTTLLSNVDIKYLGDDVEEDSLTKSNFRNYFGGSELVIAGKLTDSDVKTVNLEVLGDSANGNIVLTGDAVTNDVTSKGLMQTTDFEKITEKMWAYLTIKQLLARTEAETNATVIDDLKERAKQLALLYKFVTPLTSIVVTKPEVVDDRPTTTTTTTTPKPTTKRRWSGGYGRYGGGGGGDPHFLVRLGNLQHPLCFDMQRTPGDVINLVTDTRNDVTINSRIIGPGKINNDDEEKTFIGGVYIETKHHFVDITADSILIKDLKLLQRAGQQENPLRFIKKHKKSLVEVPWNTEGDHNFGGHVLRIIQYGRVVSIQFSFGATVIIRRHQHADDVSYLNVYIDREDGFSKVTTGLLGQFVNGQKRIYLKKEYSSKSNHPIARLQVREGPKFLEDQQHNHVLRSQRHSVRANLIERHDVLGNNTEMCYMVHKMKGFDKALLGNPTSYLVGNCDDKRGGVLLDICWYSHQ